MGVNEQFSVECTIKAANGIKASAAEKNNIGGAALPEYSNASVIERRAKRVGIGIVILHVKDGAAFHEFTKSERGTSYIVSFLGRILSSEARIFISARTLIG